MGESRRKNPDKYIDRLKAQHARDIAFYKNRQKEESQRADTLLAEKGVYIFHYVDGGAGFENSVEKGLGKALKIGGTVNIEAEIVKLELEGERVRFKMLLSRFNQVKA